MKTASSTRVGIERPTFEALIAANSPLPLWPRYRPSGMAMAAATATAPAESARWLAPSRSISAPPILVWPDTDSRSWSRKSMASVKSLAKLASWRSPLTPSPSARG